MNESNQNPLSELEKNTNYLVSIIIPTYNRAEMLTTSIQSCLDQTYKNIEIIVVDDGSIDNTREVITAFSKKDPRVIYIKKENGGLPRALNYGFKFAKGEFLTWTSDDNYYAKTAIEKMVACISQKKCFLVYCNYYKFNKRHPNKRTLIKLLEIGEITKFNVIGACFLYSRKVRDKIGDYDPDSYLAEDYDYWIRISKEFLICHIKEPLYFYMVHDESLSLKFNKELEVEIVAILVRLKNEILDVKKATNLFVRLFSRIDLPINSGNSKLLIFLYEVLNTIFLFFTYWIRFSYSNKISKIIDNFKLKGVSIQRTKDILKNISNIILRMRKISWLLRLFYFFKSKSPL